VKYLYDVIKDMKRIPELDEVGEKHGTSYARKELLWMKQLAVRVKQNHMGDGTIKDCWAWYIKQLSLWYLNSGNPQSVEYLRSHNLSSALELGRAPFDVVYGLVQSGEVPEQRGFSVLRCILGTRAIFLDLTYEEWRIILNMPHLKKDALQSAMLWFATAGQYCAVLPRDIGKFHPSFLRKRFDASKVFNLARDTAAGMHEITSMNVLQQKHDEQAEQQRARIRKEEKALYSYTPQFKIACEKGPWHLPAGTYELIERGQKHHNCVANYATSHQSFPETGGVQQVQGLQIVIARGHVTRILLSPDATVEMCIYINDGHISEVECVQCKGAYNRDMTWEFRTEICEAIKALAPEDLKVTVNQIYEGEKNSLVFFHDDAGEVTRREIIPNGFNHG
jgi:hypothetical protein